MACGVLLPHWCWEGGLDGDRHTEQLSQRGAGRSHDVITVAGELVTTIYFEGCL